MLWSNAPYGSAYDSGAFIGARSYNNVVFNNTIKVTVVPTSWNYIQLMGDNNTVDSNTIIGAFREYPVMVQLLLKTIK